MARKEGPAIIRETTLITVGALADQVAIKGTQAVAITDDFRIIKTELRAQAQAQTASEVFDLPLYLVNDDLTAVQVANAINNDGPLNSSDRDKIEAANRFVKLLGVFQHSGANGFANSPSQLLGKDNSPIISETVRWSFNKGVGWNYATMNNTGSAFTTGMIIKVTATHYGVWI